MVTVLSVERGRSSLCLTLDREGQRESLRLLSFDEPAVGEPLTAGAPLSASAVARLPRLAERHRAVSVAVRLLSLRDHSGENLKNKLLSRGVSEETADFAVCLMKKQGYIREDEQMLRRLESLFAAKRWGPYRLLAKLTEEGYDPEEVSSAISELERQGRLDFDAARRALLADYRARGLDHPGAMAKLERMGYGVED